MEVSVVVCTYNRAALLRLTLDALEAQVTPPTQEWEVIVVDNNSKDSTRGVVETFAAASAITVQYRFEPQQGLSHARNTGLAHARADIVAFTDDDVRPGPGWVASLAIAMREAGADIVGGRILPEWALPPPPWLAARPLLHRELAVMEHGAFAVVVDPRAMPPVWGANMAFRREVFARIGSFDVGRGVKGTKLYRGEELDLMDRALAAGFKAVYDPRVVVWHRIGADRIRRRHFSRHFFEHAEGRALARAPEGPLVLGVPRTRYRSAVRTVGGWLWAAVRGRRDTLDRWLESCEAMGLIWGGWKRYLERRDPGPSPSTPMTPR